MSNMIGTVQFDKYQVVEALRGSAPFFINFAMPDLEFDVPEFHNETFHLMTSTAIERIACAIPRGHAKTTLAKLAVVYYLFFSPYRFIVYLSNTVTVAAAACMDIVSFLRSDNFVSIFGNVEFAVAREAEGFYRFTLRATTEPGVWFEKSCILKAQGAGMQVRGLNIENQRPEVAVVDDLEDNENVATEEQQNKIIRWFYGPFIKALSRPRNKVIHIGNMLSNKCLLYKHCNSSEWHSKLYGCLVEDGTPLWPEMFSIDYLTSDFNIYLSEGIIDVWYAEMMNMPQAAGHGMLSATDVLFKPAPDETDIQFAFITIDPAISDENWAHRCAIVVHGFDGEHWRICDYDTSTGTDPVQLFYKTSHLAYQWGVVYVGIESVAYQAAIKQVFEYICKEKGIEGFEFINVPGRQHKTQRIAAWAGMLKSTKDKKPVYALSHGQFEILQELLAYRPGRKDNSDDLIDACAYGTWMLDNYSYQIQTIIRSSPRPMAKPISVYEISGV